MISLQSALVIEWTCAPEHLDALDDDWMRPDLFVIYLALSSVKAE